MSEPIIDKRKGISPVWILPLLAVCLGGWLLFESIIQRGIDITLTVDDSIGIVKNKTPVLFKGNQVGVVKDIQVRKDLQGVDLVIEMDKRTKEYLVEDMVFWIEKIDIKASSISGLETLLSGSYIGVQQGASTKPSRDFVALDRKPPVPPDAPGLHLKLIANEFESLNIGSGVYNKNIKIGSVQEYSLQEDDTVFIKLHIDPEYEHLVKKGSRFWNSSGITVSGGISDFKIHIPSLASIISGGIEMQTPESGKDTAQAENGQTYTLYGSLEDMVATETHVGLPLVLESDSFGSLAVGSSVYYRKVKVGEVTSVNLSPSFQKVLVDIIIYEPFKAIIRENTKFWNVSGVSVSGGVFSGINVSTESFEALMAGGIALATPNNEEMGDPVSERHRFTLHDKEDESWRKWSPEIGGTKEGPKKSNTKNDSVVTGEQE